MAEHGGAGTRYEHGKCRCADCKKAHSERIERRHMERIAHTREFGLPASVEHGASAYKNWGCRCSVCSAAHSAKCKEYSERVKSGHQPQPVSSYRGYGTLVANLPDPESSLDKRAKA